jgi:hypothetical protein
MRDIPFRRRLPLARRWWALFVAPAFVLLCRVPPAMAQSAATLGNDDLRAVLIYGLAHHNDAGPYKGRHIRVTGLFTHIDHGDDYSATLRAGNARSFDVVIIDHIAMPLGVSNVYVSCLLPRTHPYARLADAVPAGKEPSELDKSLFSLEGDIDSLIIQQRPADAQINLKLGCAVAKR